MKVVPTPAKKMRTFDAMALSPSRDRTRKSWACSAVQVTETRHHANASDVRYRFAVEAPLVLPAGVKPHQPSLPGQY
jgi:hypothetical protein